MIVLLLLMIINLTFFNSYTIISVKVYKNYYSFYIDKQ
mgnify:CR=1 FL=1